VVDWRHRAYEPQIRVRPFGAHFRSYPSTSSGRFLARSSPRRRGQISVLDMHLAAEGCSIAAPRFAKILSEFEMSQFLRIGLRQRRDLRHCFGGPAECQRRASIDSSRHAPRAGAEQPVSAAQRMGFTIDNASVTAHRVRAYYNTGRIVTFSAPRLSSRLLAESFTRR
jgi:hypothetical protein